MEEEKKLTSKTHRSFFLSILCVSIFSYSALFIFIFLTGILFNGWITSVLNDFLAAGEVQNSSILILSFVGFILSCLSFFSAYLIWNLKRKGLYIYLISSALIIILPYLFQFGNLISAIVLLLLVSLILAHFGKLN